MRRAVMLGALVGACFRSETIVASKSDGGLTIELRQINGGCGRPSSAVLMEPGQRKGSYGTDCYGTPKAELEVQGKERRVAFRCAPDYTGWILYYVDHGTLFRAGSLGRGNVPDWTLAKPFAESPREIAHSLMKPERQQLYLETMSELGDKPLFDAIVAFRSRNSCPPCKKFEEKLSPERREDLRKLGL